jgi:transposase
MAARRKFTGEFKVEAVKLVRDRGVSIAQAAHPLPRRQTRVRARRALAGRSGL